MIVYKEFYYFLWKTGNCDFLNLNMNNYFVSRTIRCYCDSFSISSHQKTVRKNFKNTKNYPRSEGEEELIEIQRVEKS